ncbi:host specificity factor TipJ family phage tail protein [Bordetella genomosp. 12]|uniref:Tip attachment protein J domain-containing protein n=1 Tax=Bordetella genomosp. 12 TaxID=463035 RepID=A0A261VM61_9BORD|nr:host specificity factor TipJ family phage tail protein [Bordetella genomosp. 12]OZI74592.1 hypothetical protein CAL22_09040 [Bordetella genomosp. 12]
MTRVYLYRAPDERREEFDVDDVLAFLVEQFGPRFPAGGRIMDLSSGAIVTPRTPEAVLQLQQATGPLLVEVFPREFISLGAVLTALAVSTASIILSSIFAQDPPTATQRNVQQESPNNGLSERTNRARVNGRIPDVYGKVRSTPDLLAAPYKVFENHVEKEVAYMCVGRGAYDIQDVRDDTTLASEIPGMSVEVFGPNTSPNSGAAPQLRIGNPIGLPVLNVKRCNSVNGQVLQPQDVGQVVRRGMVFSSPNVITSQDEDVDFSEFFVPGDVVAISGAAQYAGAYTYTITIPPGALIVLEGSTSGSIRFSGDHRANWAVGQFVTVSNGTVTWDAAGGIGSTNINGTYPITGVGYSSLEDRTILYLDVSANSTAWALIGGASDGAGGGPTLTRPSDQVQFDLSGTYTVNTVTSSILTLNNAVVVNPQWQVLADDCGGVSKTLYPVITTTGERWVGWFTVESVKPITRLIANLVALNGLYKDSGRQQYRTNVSVVIEAVPLNAAGDEVGPVQSWSGTVVGSASTRATRALTMDVMLATPSRKLRIRARRVSASDTTFEGSVVDEVKWRDLYACASVAASHFGNVTTVHAVTMATDGALAVKERKLNMLVTRKLPRREADGSFSTTLYPTTNVADILSAICLDPKIGNRSPSEVDFDNFYQTAEDIRDYFGVDVAQFNYTIDKDNLSFEEIVSMVAETIFCKAYRRGSVIRLFFERQTDDSALLFNHRNKLPGSENRTDQIVSEERYDGIEYQWIDPDTDAMAYIYLPEDRSAVNAKVIESVGVRSIEHAYLQAWRAWNKLRFQDETTAFDALPEANLLTLSERILVADNTRGESWDGDVLSVVEGDGRLIQLSQPFTWGPGPYTIFLQGSDGLVDAISVSDGGGPRWALLARAPRTPVIPRGQAYNTTTYIIVNAANARKAKPFLVTEKGAPNDDGTIPLTAINYDDRYYQNDRDFYS